MADRLMSLLGLCRRAGKLVLGNDPVIDSINLKKAKLVVVASDCSRHTAKDVLSCAHRNGVKAHLLRCDVSSQMLPQQALLFLS